MVIGRAPQRSAGFTLIELLITMGIIAILAAIAYPSYQSYVRSSDRTDATRSLLQTAQTLERCYSQNFTYLANCSIVSGTTSSPQGYYSINVNLQSASQYTLTATPAESPQTGDSTCAEFQLLSSGQQLAQNAGGTDTTQTCWGSN